MPRPRFTALDPERRRTILAAAAEELAQRGPDGASYNRIIARAGASKGAMYYYFDDKQDLLLAVLDDALTRAAAAIGGPAEVDDVPAYWSEISALVTRALAFLAREPVLAGLAARLLSASGGPLTRAAEEVTRRISAATHDLLRRGQAIGAVRDDLPLALLTHLLTGVGEAMDRWLLPRWSELDPAELAALPARVVDLFTRIAAPHIPAPARKQTLRTPRRGTMRP